MRGAVFSAYVVSWVAVALLFMWLLDGEAGLVDASLRSLAGLPKVNWLGDPGRRALHARPSSPIWKIAGYAMVIFLAGLQDIPPVLYEAAALDGAGAFVRFRERDLARLASERGVRRDHEPHLVASKRSTWCAS